MRRRRGRYLKSREEVVYIIRKDENGTPSILFEYDNAIVSEREPVFGFNETKIPYYINFNSVIGDVRESDIVVRKNLLHDSQLPLDYDETNNPLNVISVDKRSNSSRISCVYVVIQPK